MSNILHSQVERDDPGVLAALAANLRSLRRRNGWSQSLLAERSGLSRRMISAIESGGANIGIHNIDRLASALGVSFAQLIRPAAEPGNQRIQGLAWRGDGELSSGTLLGTAPAAHEAELWRWALAPGDSYDAQSLTDGWHEMVLVLAGTLTIEADQQVETVDRGDFRIFAAPRRFRFVNKGARPARFARIVVH